MAANLNQVGNNFNYAVVLVNYYTANIKKQQFL